MSDERYLAMAAELDYAREDQLISGEVDALVRSMKDMDLTPLNRHHLHKLATAAHNLAQAAWAARRERDELENQ